MVGVACGLCGDEAFQLVPREVRHKVDVCPQCRRRIDADAEEEERIRQASGGLSKAERRRIFQEESFEWANELHGKAVIIYWDENTHQVFSSPESNYHARGTAYRTSNECGGWGKVKIVLDPSEHGRITLACHETMYCDIMKEDMYFTRGQLACGLLNCQKVVFVMDGKRWGKMMSRGEDGEYYTRVSWGCRKCLQMDEAG